jgi:hypothetical protein
VASPSCVCAIFERVSPLPSIKKGLWYRLDYLQLVVQPAAPWTFPTSRTSAAACGASEPGGATGAWALSTWDVSPTPSRRPTSGTHGITPIHCAFHWSGGSIAPSCN